MAREGTHTAGQAAHEAALAQRLRAAGCVYAEQEAGLLLGAFPGADELQDAVARRVGGEPLEHVLGWVRFAGLRIAVGPGVFVPRQRSEFLVECAVALTGDPNVTGGPAPRVLDLCCGSGALGAAFRTRVPEADVHAVDLDPVAVRYAGQNLGGQVYCGDLFAAAPAALRFDVVLANVPYVPSGELATMPPEARDHEPRTALDGGPDGLDLLRRVAAQAPARLTARGVLLTECAAGQAEAACAVLGVAGLGPSVRRDPERGATVVLAHNGAGSC